MEALIYRDDRYLGRNSFLEGVFCPERISYPEEASRLEMVPFLLSKELPAGFSSS